MQPHRIVVGYDASAPAHRALEWAVQEAGPRGVVVVVTGWTADGTTAASAGDVRAALSQRQRGAIRGALRHIPPASRPVVSGLVVMADPVTALVDAARVADLVVIGSPGRAHGALCEPLAWALARDRERFGGACPLRVLGPEPRPACERAMAGVSAAHRGRSALSRPA